jgi:polygalacturonase
MKLKCQLALVTVPLLLAGCLGGRYAQPPRRELDLQAVLDAAQDNATLTIPYGEYVVQQGLKLNGRRNVTITASPGTRILAADVMEDVLTLTECESVRIENLHLGHVKPLESYECEGSCLKFTRCRDVRVANCELTGCGAEGVYAFQSERLDIGNCYVHDNTYAGFYFAMCRSVLVHDCRLVHNFDRMSGYSNADIEFRNNTEK